MIKIIHDDFWYTNNFFRSQKLHTASNRLLISLLLADFILLFNCYFVVYQNLKGFPVFGAIGNIYNRSMKSLSKILHVWYIYILLHRLSYYICFIKGCQIYGFTATISSLAEIWSLTAVSVDRLQAILNPLNAQKRISKSQVLMLEFLGRNL